MPMNKIETPDISKLIIFSYISYVVQMFSIVILSFVTDRYKVSLYIYEESIENLALMLFIVDACLTRNVPQMRGYMVLEAVTPFYFLIGSTLPANKYFFISICTRIAIAFITVTVTYVFVRRFSKSYNWYYFKRIGASKHLKDALKTRKQLVLGFKTLLVIRVRNILTTRVVLISTVFFYIANISAILTYIAFLYSQNSENEKLRIFIIILYGLDEIRNIVVFFTYIRVLFLPDEM